MTLHTSNACIYLCYYSTTANTYASSLVFALLCQARASTCIDYPFRRVRRKVIYEYAYISGSRPEKYRRVYSNIIIHDLTRSDKKNCCAFYNLVDTYDKPYKSIYLVVLRTQAQ